MLAIAAASLVILIGFCASELQTHTESGEDYSLDAGLAGMGMVIGYALAAALAIRLRNRVQAE